MGFPCSVKPHNHPMKWVPWLLQLCRWGLVGHREGKQLVRWVIKTHSPTHSEGAQQQGLGPNHCTTLSPPKCFLEGAWPSRSKYVSLSTLSSLAEFQDEHISRRRDCVSEWDWELYPRAGTVGWEGDCLNHCLHGDAVTGWVSTQRALSGGESHSRTLGPSILAKLPPALSYWVFPLVAWKTSGVAVPMSQ